MNLDHTSIFHIFSFVFNTKAPKKVDLLSLSPFLVCKAWNEVLTGPGSISFWQTSFHKRFPGFLAPKSPSKKRVTSAVSHDYRKLFLYTASVVQVHSCWFDPKISKEFDDQYESPQETGYSAELVNALQLRLFTRKFKQFSSSNVHHLLYGPSGCGKSTSIESLARMWGSHLITIQYPEFIKAAARIEWSGFADILCNYILSFTSSNMPVIIHLHNLTHASSSLTQNALSSLLTNISVDTVWTIGTTNMANSSQIQLSEHFYGKLYVPFPAAAERETYLKSLIIPSSLISSSASSNRFSRIPLTSSSSSPSSPSSVRVFRADEPVPPVAPNNVHLLALRTHDFTYTDLKALSDLLHEEFMLTEQRVPLPFVKLMEVFSTVVPRYKSDDAKNFDGFDPNLMVRADPMTRRRRSVPTVI